MSHKEQNHLGNIKKRNAVFRVMGMSVIYVTLLSPVYLILTELCYLTLGDE
jgi:hypothetical protein